LYHFQGGYLARRVREIITTEKEKQFRKGKKENRRKEEKKKNFKRYHDSKHSLSAELSLLPTPRSFFSGLI
jgi:hypothetical protein